MLTSILNSGLIMGLILAGSVLSLGVSFRLFNFPDLTIDGSFALGAIVTASLFKAGENMFFSVGLSMVCGGIAGVATGFLHTFLKINKFLSGIIVVTALYSILIRIMGGGNISIGQKKTAFDLTSRWDLANGVELGTIVILMITYVLIIIFYIWLLRSPFGIKLRAACLNVELSKSIGLNSSRSIIIALFFTNLLSAFSGALFCLKSSFADIGYLQGILIISLASLTIGEKIITSNKINRLHYVIIASVIGSVLYQSIWAIALKLDLEPTDMNFITAIIVVLLFIWKNNKKELNNVELE